MQGGIVSPNEEWLNEIEKGLHALLSYVPAALLASLTAFLLLYCRLKSPLAGTFFVLLHESKYSSVEGYGSVECHGAI